MTDSFPTTKSPARASAAAWWRKRGSRKSTSLTVLASQYGTRVAPPPSASPGSCRGSPQLRSGPHQVAKACPAHFLKSLGTLTNDCGDLEPYCRGRDHPMTSQNEATLTSAVPRAPILPCRQVSIRAAGSRDSGRTRPGRLHLGHRQRPDHLDRPGRRYLHRHFPATMRQRRRACDAD